MVVPRTRHRLDAHCGEPAQGVTVRTVAVLLFRIRRSGKEAVRALAKRVYNAGIYPVADDHGESNVRHRGIPFFPDCASRIIVVLFRSCKW